MGKERGLKWIPDIDAQNINGKTIYVLSHRRWPGVLAQTEERHIQEGLSQWERNRLDRELELWKEGKPVPLPRVSERDILKATELKVWLKKTNRALLDGISWCVRSFEAMFEFYWDWAKWRYKQSRIKYVSEDWVKPSFKTFERVRGIINHLGRSSFSQRIPHITTSPEGEIVLEWWNNPKKVILYLTEEEVIFIKIWGINPSEEMEDGILEDTSKIEDLLKWLYS